MNLFANLLGLLGADPVNVLKRDDDALVGRNIDAGYTSHSLFAPCSAALRPHAEASRVKRLGVRWRPALAENLQTQKVPCARNGAGTQMTFGMGGI